MLKTITRSIEFTGVGLHSGKTVMASLHPALPGTGKIFRRLDLPGRPTIPARQDSTGMLTLCTTLCHNGVTVSTVEHLLSALSALDIDDVRVDVSGPELPIMDGSSLAFYHGIKQAGISVSNIPRRYIEVIRPIEVRDGDKVARLDPYYGSAWTFHIDFPNPHIGRSSLTVDMGRDSYEDIALARTFAMQEDITMMRNAGLIKGGSLENAIVVSQDGILNEDGLRRQDEFVRHKILDAMGDLSLVQYPILGWYTGWYSGHALNNKLARALMESSSWRWSDEWKKAA